MERLLEAMPKLADDAMFLPSRRGAYFRNDGHYFVLDEDGTYPLMERLAGAFTGERSVGAICDDHEPQLRPRILALVRQLLEAGILRDERGRRERVLPERIRAHFSSQLAFLAHLDDDCERRFERFRNSPVLLVGSGVTFGACAAALVRNGL